VKRVLLARPDLSAPLVVVVALVVGMIACAATWILYLLGIVPAWAIVPVLVATLLLLAAFYSTAMGSRVDRRWQRRSAARLIVAALLMAVVAVMCR